MSRYQPPFSITSSILSQVVEMGELRGHWAAHSGRTSPLRRKENRIRTVQASLAVEHNSLTTGQVTAMMEGKLRNGDGGVYRGSRLVHMAPPASQMQRLIDDLPGGLKQTDHHPLIARPVFHYDVSFIHPFTDGHGRMGRLWQTLILSHWRTERARLPGETLTCPAA